MFFHSGDNENAVDLSIFLAVAVIAFLVFVTLAWQIGKLDYALHNTSNITIIGQCQSVTEHIEGGSNYFTYVIGDTRIDVPAEYRQPEMAQGSSYNVTYHKIKGSYVFDQVVSATPIELGE